jgi:hypothetical protein
MHFSLLQKNYIVFYCASHGFTTSLIIKQNFIVGHHKITQSLVLLIVQAAYKNRLTFLKEHYSLHGLYWVLRNEEMQVSVL